MLKNISIGSFIIAVVLLTAVYYFIVAMLYYRAEVYRWLRGKTKGFEKDEIK